MLKFLVEIWLQFNEDKNNFFLLLIIFSFWIFNLWNTGYVDDTHITTTQFDILIIVPEFYISYSFKRKRKKKSIVAAGLISWNRRFSSAERRRRRWIGKRNLKQRGSLIFEYDRVDFHRGIFRIEISAGFYIVDKRRHSHQFLKFSL